MDRDDYGQITLLSDEGGGNAITRASVNAMAKGAVGIQDDDEKDRSPRHRKS